MEPMTPKGACSMSIMPLSPVSHRVTRSSMPGCAAADEQVLLHLVGNTSVSGFFMGEPREVFGVVDARLAHGGNQLAALFQCHFGELRLRGLGVCHRFLRSVAQPAAGAAVRLRRRGRRFLLHGFRKASHDFIRDLPNLLFCQCHGCFSFPESGSSRAGSVNRRSQLDALFCGDIPRQRRENRIRRIADDPVAALRRAAHIVLGNQPARLAR